MTVLVLGQETCSPLQEGTYNFFYMRDMRVSVFSAPNTGLMETKRQSRFATVSDPNMDILGRSVPLLTVKCSLILHSESQGPDALTPQVQQGEGWRDIPIMQLLAASPRDLMPHQKLQSCCSRQKTQRASIGREIAIRHA